MIFAILIVIIACGLFVWYLYRRSQNETSENVEEPMDSDEAEFEDVLLTGLMLNDIYDGDDDSSDDMDSDGGYDGGFDGGYDGGFDGGDGGGGE